MPAKCAGNGGRYKFKGKTKGTQLELDSARISQNQIQNAMRRLEAGVTK